jgi:hypothetical protein
MMESGMVREFRVVIYKPNRPEEIDLKTSANNVLVA